MTPREWILQHKEEMIQDICRLVSIPSVSVETGDPSMPYGEPCLRVLKAGLILGQVNGFKTINHENQCGSIIWNENGRKELGIFNHLDVVPAGEGWIYDPFQPIVQDGLIIARGADDNKGPFVAAFYALRYLKESGFMPKCRIRIFLGCNEETNMNDIHYYLSKNPEPDFSIVPDINFPVCIGEKGMLRITAFYPVKSAVLLSFSSGSMINQVPGTANARLLLSNQMRASLENVCTNYNSHLEREIEKDHIYKLTVTGISKHAAFPEGSQSAEVLLSKLLLASGVLDQQAERLMKSIISLFGDYYGAGIHASFADNISGRLTHVGSMAELQGDTFVQLIDIRYSITVNREKMMKQIQSALASKGWVISKINDNKPHYYNPNTDEVAALLSVCKEHFGGNPKPFVTGGGTYAKKLQRAVGFGMGFSDHPKRFGQVRGGAHQPDEYTEIDNLVKGFLVYTDAICKLDEVLGGI